MLANRDYSNVKTHAIMLKFTTSLPLSLYIHIPWCVRKCPYCDFNSHAAKDLLPEKQYVEALLDDLETRLPLIQSRSISSIFFGGGTPSLFSANAINDILTGIVKRVPLDPNLEITLEANPGTVDQAQFAGFYQAGINRLSLGVQSLQNHHLKSLGRIHDETSAVQAIKIAKTAGFTNINLDLMFGLPKQTIHEALFDLESALTFQPTHLSWYQLTIEPNTAFYRQPPKLPDDDYLWEMQLAGQSLLQAAGFNQYEVSAYARQATPCQHNKNYWEFGDYLGIGAGAHSKITQYDSHNVIRFSQVRHPKDYLNAVKRRSLNTTIINESDLIFEFMLNALRLTSGVPSTLFTERCGMTLSHIEPILAEARSKKLLEELPHCIRPTESGKRFLNNLIALFLPK
jgi:oxygen-independent coproporphyrinogen-3 oxidase